MIAYARAERTLRTALPRATLRVLALLLAAACGSPADGAAPEASVGTVEGDEGTPSAMNEMPSQAGEPDPRDPSAPSADDVEGGGQTGGIGADNVTFTSLRLDEVGPGGFTPAEAIAAFSGEVSAELAYETGERTTVSFQIAANGAVVQGGGGATEGPYVFEAWDVYVNSNRLIVGVDVRFATADGAFDEEVAVELSVHSLEAGFIYFELDTSDLQGGYVAPFDREAASEEASAAARVRVLSNLYREGALVETNGELYGDFPTPEGSSSQIRVGRW